MESPSDKEWAQKYILDPLTAPEPSQVHAREARQAQRQHSKSRTSSSNNGSGGKTQRSGDRTPKSSSSKISHSNPYTPPPSASPTASSFHPSNPFSEQYSPTTPTRNPRLSASRTQSGSSDSSTGSASGNVKPPSYRKAVPPPTSSDRQTRPRSSSALTPQDLAGSHHHRSSSTTNDHRQILSQVPQRSASSGGQHRRNTSLPQRFPGDMSHRPLDMIKRETKAANRHPHHRSHRRHPSAASQTDTIDALDTIGGNYHHGGPYDATLASRNVHEKYSPLAAVRDSNMEAIKATPREFIEDSLKKHVPLQGTAIVPSGAYDFSGQRMEYKEGADLMREPDAAGGAYKQWDGIQYHPDDLKGKGEPSYTIERDAKKMKEREGLLRPEGIEMTVPLRQRSRSHGTADLSQAESSGFGMHRSNTTGKSGKKLSEGLKRRFGSMRRKKEAPVESVR